jgi:hypothetical protein
MKEDLDHIDSLVKTLGVSLNLADPDGTMSTTGYKDDSEKKVWKAVQDDYGKLAGAIPTLGKSERTNKLLISTRYPVAVSSLLSKSDFVNNAEMFHSCLEAAYPDDALSQALDLWLVLAKGCGLIDGYQLAKEKGN